ncbi:branched-chain amino acid ABC transporter permease [Zavarzinia sp.]|uniref:branched-chain amino acid ABC transporter permease n=1 Tax=Zavarzinia sp. TaxID=2027920 RepID=UPI003BB49AF4|nr:branched-chain amino acid ABC transporter permease [Zavarzinia sp.]
MSDFIVHVLIIAATYGIAAVSLNLQIGVAGLMNFGQIAFFGIGGYAVAMAVRAGLPPLAGIPLGVLVAALAGALVGRLGRNLKAEYWAIATLGIAEIFRTVLINEGWATGGAGGIGGDLSLFPGLSGKSAIWAMLGVAVIGLALSFLVMRDLTERQFGRILRLTREQPDLAISFGHDIVRYKVKAMAMAAGVAAFGGSLATSYIAYISPGDLVAFGTFLLWTMVIIGGIGNHRGAVLGAFAVQFIFVGALFLKDGLGIPSELAGALRMLIVGVLLLAFLMIRPAGLVPERLRKINAED